MNCEVTALARLAEQGAPATCLSLPPQAWDFECCHSQHFYVGAQDNWATSPETFPTIWGGLLGRRHPRSVVTFLREDGGRGARMQRRCGDAQAT